MSVTIDQRTEALKLANEVRSFRAELKRDLKNGDADISFVLSGELPDWLDSMQVGDLLTSLRLVGRSRAHGYLARVGNVSYTRRLDRLTTRQRVELLHILAASGKARTKFERGDR